MVYLHLLLNPCKNKNGYSFHFIPFIYYIIYILKVNCFSEYHQISCGCCQKRIVVCEDRSNNVSLTSDIVAFYYIEGYGFGQRSLNSVSSQWAHGKLSLE